MDTISLKELLEKTFKDTFEFHPKFYEEFCELVKNSGEEKRIIKLLIEKLFAIIELKGIDFGTKWLEQLKGYDNMYSLHINTNSTNYRLLFSKRSEHKYFLHMFYEKSGKYATSYDKHVSIAINRRDNN